MTYSWQNADGEPIMSGEAWRFEQQLDDEYMADFYDDDEYGPEPHEYDTDDLDDRDVPWCYGCDGYAVCGEYEPDGAPLYRDGMGPDDPVRCDND